MTTTTEATTEADYAFDRLRQRIVRRPDTANRPGARLLLPFTERAAAAWPDTARAEAHMRDGLAFLAGFCRGGDVGPDEEAALLVAARNYVEAAA